MKTYTELKKELSSQQKLVRFIENDLAGERKNLQNIEGRIRERFPKLVERPKSLGYRVSALLSKQAWRKRKSWSRSDIQSLLEFREVSQVSLNVLLAAMASKGSIARVSKGHYTCRTWPVL